MNAKRRLWLLHQAFTAAIFSLFSLYIIYLSFSRENTVTNLPNFPGKFDFPVNVYVYDLPTKFTSGLVENYWKLRGCHVGSPVADVSPLKQPPKLRIVRVSDPLEADFFLVPSFFSSVVGSQLQEDLIRWLEEQDYWRRNSGRDHVFLVKNPNEIGRVRYRIKNSVLLESGMEQLTKDVDLCDSWWHSESSEEELGSEKKGKTLLFFMTDPYGKEHEKVNDRVFQALKNEKDVIAKDESTLGKNQCLVLRLMRSSKFCLVPSGFTSCKLSNAIVCLCIPVIVNDQRELPFEDVIDYAKIAIFVEYQNVVNKGFLVTMLRNVTSKRILEYQHELKKVKHYFHNKDPNVTVNQIWRQLQQKLPIIRTLVNRDKLQRKGI